MPSPTVEAIIVSFNTREILRDALNSLRLYRPPSDVATLSVAVFDSASTDGSVEMIRDEFPEVRLICSEENVGYGPGNNLLASSSRADYVMLLNSDVVLVTDVIEPLVDALVSEPKAILASPRLIYPNGQVQYSAHALPGLAFEYAEYLRGTRLGRKLAPIVDAEKFALGRWERGLTERRVPDRRPGSIWATCWLIRRVDIEEFGLFDETFAMYDLDLDFCKRAIDAGRTLIYEPGVQMIHLGGSSSTSPEKLARMREGRRAYFRRHHGRLAELAFDGGLACLRVAVQASASMPRRAAFRRSASH